jgi:hypothetical protein
MPDPTPVPGWFELLPRTEDAALIEIALELVRASFPDGQYDNLSHRKLMHHMVPRENRQGKWIPGTRVFWRPGAAEVENLAAIYFLRMKKSDLPLAYAMTAGARERYDKDLVYNALVAISAYMEQGVGVDYDKLEVMSKENPPSAKHENMKYAIGKALLEQKLVNRVDIPDAGDQWPVKNLNSWRVKPH